MNRSRSKCRRSSRRLQTADSPLPRRVRGGPRRSVAISIGILVVITAVAGAIGSELAGWPWKDDEAGPAPAGEAQATGGVGLASLESAPVPAMCDNPEGSMTDGRFTPPATSGAVGVTSLADGSPFSADGWASVAVGDLTGDEVAEGAAVIVCTYGGNLTEGQVVVYGRGPSILTTIPFDGAKGLRIRGGVIDVLGLTPGGDDPVCCPSVVEARSFRLHNDTVVDAGREVVDASAPISEGAWGRLPIDSTYADVALALGRPIDVDNAFDDRYVDFELEEGMCLTASPTGEQEVSFLGTSDRATVLYVGVPSVRTTEGIGVGSTEQEVRDTYGQQLFEGDNIYRDTPDLYLGDPDSPSGTPGVRFTVDPTRRTVDLIMVGDFPFITAAEGCA